MIDLCFLGTCGMMPLPGRWLSSVLMRSGSALTLFDCGEGTQMQLARYKIRRSRINHIFISHLHGDHYFGLIGLLSSLHLNGRIKPMKIFAPAALAGFSKQSRAPAAA